MDDSLAVTFSRPARRPQGTYAHTYARAAAHTHEAAHRQREPCPPRAVRVGESEYKPVAPIHHGHGHARLESFGGGSSAHCSAEGIISCHGFSGFPASSLQRRELDSSLSPPAPFPVDEAERPCLYHVLGIHPATSSHPPRGEQGKSQVSQKRGSSPTSLGPVTRPTSHGLAARGMLVVANEQRPKSLFPKSSRPTKGPHPSNLGLLGAFGVKQQPRPWHCALQSRPSMPSPNRAISPLEQPTAGAAHLAQSTGAVALGSRL